MADDIDRPSPQLEIVLGGRRELKKGKTEEKFISFNAYIALPAIGFGILLTGLRINADGKILPPVKWNPMSKKFFNTTYLSAVVAKDLARVAREKWPELNIKDDDASWKTLVYDDKRIIQLLPETVI